MKQKKRVPTKTDFTETSLTAMERLMADRTLNTGDKMIALMKQAEEICDRKDPLPDVPPQIDLFSDIPRPDPHAACVEHFIALIDSAKENAATIAFDPSNVTPKAADSPLHAAFDLKRRKGKQHKELKIFNTLIEKNFPKSIAESDAVQQRIDDDDRYHKLRAPLFRQGKIPTRAHFISNKDVSPTYKYVLLMEHAAKALQETPRIDLKKPNANPELLVALARTGKNPNDDGLLYHIKSDPVKPDLLVTASDGINRVTPMMLAQNMAKTPGLEELGRLFQYRLQNHADALAAYERNPDAFQKGYKRKPS